MQYAFLPARGLLRLSGEDAPAFLQGLVSNDVTRLAPGVAVYAALLSPQGKFLHDFFLLAQGGAILMDAESARLADLQQRLAAYRLRSRVTVEALPDITAAALWGEGDMPSAGPELHIAADPRLPQLGWRMMGEKAAIASWCAAQGIADAGAEAYDRMRLAAGVPDGSRDMIVDKSLLLECGFEELHGVDFAKGCYVGQEVTARSKYRGQVRKLLYKVHAVSRDLPPPGTPVMAGESTAGEMRSSCGDSGLALLRTDEVKKAALHNEPLRAGGGIITASLPSWMKPPPDDAL